MRDSIAQVTSLASTPADGTNDGTGFDVFGDVRVTLDDAMRAVQGVRMGPITVRARDAADTGAASGTIRVDGLASLRALRDTIDAAIATGRELETSAVEPGGAATARVRDALGAAL